MAKYYVQSGAVQLVLQARSPKRAAIAAFQWSCDRQATIDAESPLEHVHIAEQLGWQLEEVIAVSERRVRTSRREGVRHAPHRRCLARRVLPVGRVRQGRHTRGRFHGQLRGEEQATSGKKPAFIHDTKARRCARASLHCLPMAAPLADRV